MAVEEAADALAWLDARGFRVDRVVANRVTPPPPEPCAWCRARRHAEAKALAALRRAAGRGRPIVAVAAQDREPRRTRGLAPIARALGDPRPFAARAGRAPLRVTASRCASGTAVTEVMLAGPGTRLLMFGGKGGVGKTTCAAAFAIEAARGEARPRVLLVSTDPAHSLADVLGRPVSAEPRPVAASLPNLLVRELDAAAVYARFRERFAMAVEDLFDRIAITGSTGAAVASQERHALRDLVELAPPGVDELVAIVEVTDVLEASGSARACDLLVLDTAPSGHALRLLEMPAVVHDWVKALMAILLKYQPVVGAGELGRVLLQLAQGLGRLRRRLGDAERTRFVVVTRAAALPRAEAVRLLTRLRGAGIHVPAVVVNANGAGTCRRCRHDSLSQTREIARLRSALPRTMARTLVSAPAELPPPHGIARLGRWRGAWRRIPDTSR
jgi:arsenite-transporting ATPase